MRKTIAAIISYNGREFLPNCIKSCQLAELEILVIDNNSKDGSLEYLCSQNHITLIKNNTNTGFTNAANQAVKYSINNDFDYLLLLNQDVEFEKEMVSLLLVDFEENPSMAVVSPMQMNEQNEAEYQFKKICTDYGTDLTQTLTTEVKFVNAACWLMDLKKVREIGLFNPIFKNYGSDFNYCHRANYYGYKIGLNPNAKMIHKKKNQKDYEQNIFKSIKSYNTYFLALILNPLQDNKPKKVIYQLAKGAIKSFMTFNFRKSILKTNALIFLIFKSINPKNFSQQI
ncbi:MAG: glycosyltransferase [Bacteroidia bacterium]|nr:glycosyltransferase [Bacteroidia bacterium]